MILYDGHRSFWFSFGSAKYDPQTNWVVFYVPLGFSGDWNLIEAYGGALYNGFVKCY